ncbi:hypothetical protein SGRIM128S_02909 [Streptomyces griseomycini]
MNKSSTVDLVVVGLGYVGLPLARSAAAAGLRVVGLDRSRTVVEGLNGGRSHVDDITDAEVGAMLDQGFRASDGRESLWAFRHQKKYRPAFWLTCMELGLWLVFGSAMFYSMVILPITEPARFLDHIGDYALFMVLMGYLRNVRYLDFPRRGMGFVKRFGMFLLAPLYGLIQLFLLTPLRFYALLTLHKGSWGTRQAGVEVSVAGDHEADVTEIFEEEDPYSDKKVTETLQLMRLEGVALRTRPRTATIPSRPQPLPGYDEQHHQNVPQQPVSWGTPAPAPAQAPAGHGGQQWYGGAQQQWQGGGHGDPYHPQQQPYPPQQQPYPPQQPYPQGHGRDGYQGGHPDPGRPGDGRGGGR